MSESSFKKAFKRKTYKERGQIKSRKKMGFLEKRKDYLLRARDYQKKKKAVKILREKAYLKNPDEFYFKMIKKEVWMHEKKTNLSFCFKNLLNNHF